MAAAENKGNLITRRAFTDDTKEHPDRMKVLHEITGRKMSTCYKYTEVVGMFGSGLPSPLHLVIESVGELYRLDAEQGCEISFAQMVAEAPLAFLRQLQAGEGGVKEEEAGAKLDLLVKQASDANYLLGGRCLRDLALVHLTELAQTWLAISTIVQELSAMTDRLIAEQADSYPGAPLQRERVLSGSR